jgi:3-oxoacyl-ACP reductase-like protein
MGIFSSIASAIFGHSSSPGTSAAAGSSAAPTSPAGASAAPGSAAAKPMTTAEVETLIAKLAAAQNEQYNWKQSIVDLMKLLKLDSSLSARKQLAQELGYKGELNGSAEMNIWLHKQVMTKLAEGGGVVPESLKHA